MPCTRRLQSKISSLVDAIRIGIVPPRCTVAPQTRHPIGDPCHGPSILAGRPEVISGSKTRGVLTKKFFRQREIAVERVEHMLPRANGVRPPDAHRSIREEAANQIR